MTQECLWLQNLLPTPVSLLHPSQLAERAVASRSVTDRFCCRTRYPLDSVWELRSQHGQRESRTLM